MAYVKPYRWEWDQRETVLVPRNDGMTLYLGVCIAADKDRMVAEAVAELLTLLPRITDPRVAKLRATIYGEHIQEASH